MNFENAGNDELDERAARDEQQQEPRPPAFSDDALALRFADAHGTELRYVAALNKWLRWDGARWCFDDTLAAFDLARKVCREAAAQCNKPKIASIIASAKTVTTCSANSASELPGPAIYCSNSSG